MTPGLSDNGADVPGKKRTQCHTPRAFRNETEERRQGERAESTPPSEVAVPRIVQAYRSTANKTKLLTIGLVVKRVR